jgi:hypothetical protein
MKTFLNFIIARGSEASTYRGLALLLSSVGIAINPTLLPQIITVGIAVSGLIGMLTADKPAPVTK